MAVFTGGVRVKERTVETLLPPRKQSRRDPERRRAWEPGPLRRRHRGPALPQRSGVHASRARFGQPPERRRGRENVPTGHGPS
jgi:hypothetical protein